jgi:predicted aldo/keto reductase-like oxidoreductase
MGIFLSKSIQIIKFPLEKEHQEPLFQNNCYVNLFGILAKTAPHNGRGEGKNSLLLRKGWRVLMWMKAFGKTSVQVPALGFGALRIDELSGNDAHDLMLYAHQKGIRFFDTAPDYASGKSQEIAGCAFSQMQGDFFVSASYGRIPQRYETQKDFLKRLERSMRQLQVKQIQFYHLWNITSYENWLLYKDEGEFLQGILTAKKNGLIQHLCVTTTLNALDFKRVMEQIPQISGVMINLNVLNLHQKKEFLDVCRTNQIGVIAASPLLGGILPTRPELVPLLPNDTAMQSALRYVMANPAVCVTLSGFCSMAQIEEAISCVERLDGVLLPTAPPDTMAPLCINCRQCRFCLTKTPVSKLMTAYNQMILTGKKELVIEHIFNIQQLEKRDVRKCVGCKLCHQICPQSIPISERIREIIALL